MSSSHLGCHHALQGQVAINDDGVFFDLSDRFEALRRQDETPPGPSSTPSPFPDYFPEWRDKIVEWSYQVVDHFDLDREIVAAAVSYLDRYVDTLVATERASPLTKRSFQIVAATCLYLSCKLHCGSSRRPPLTMQIIVELGRGYFGPGHVEAMEREVLRALRYRLHAPTAQAFVRHLSLLIPRQQVSPRARYRIEEAARFVAELGVFEHSLSSARRSSVGLAALMNAVDRHVPPLDPRARAIFTEAVRGVAGLDPRCEEVKACRRRLAEIYRSDRDAAAAERHEEQAPPAMSGRQQEEEEVEVRIASPVSVAVFGAAAAIPPEQEQYAAAGHYFPTDRYY